MVHLRQDPAEFGAKAKEAAAHRLEGAEMDPFGTAYLRLERAERNRALETIAAVRDAQGRMSSC